MSTRSNSILQGSIDQYLFEKPTRKKKSKAAVGETEQIVRETDHLDGVSEEFEGETEQLDISGVSDSEQLVGETEQQPDREIEHPDRDTPEEGLVILDDLEVPLGRMPGPTEDENVLTEYQQLMAVLGRICQTVEAMSNNSVAREPIPRNQYQKLEDCPIKRKTVSLESWLREVELWNDCNQTDATSLGKKYQKFIESIRNSEDAEEIIAVATAEFVENVSFARSNADTISKMIGVLKTKLGNTAFEKSSEAWLNFVNIKQKDDEDVKDFCIRFTQSVTMLRNAYITIDESALAIQLLNRTNPLHFIKKITR